MHDDETKTTIAAPDEERGLGYDALQGLAVGGGLAAGKHVVDAAAGAIKDHFTKDDSGPKIVLPPGVDDAS